MKGKNIFRVILLTLGILFITLYTTQAFGYYEYTNKKTNTLTENAVKDFEKDIKEGKTIKAENYIKEENDYNNNLSKMGLGISNLIEKTFDAVMNFIFKEINDAVTS